MPRSNRLSYLAKTANYTGFTIRILVHPEGGPKALVRCALKGNLRDANMRIFGKYQCAGMLLAACAVLPVWAAPIVSGVPDQAAFDSFAKDVTAAFDYRPLQPDAGGILGLDVSAFGTVAQIHDRDAYHTFTGRNDHVISLGGVQVAKGLPGNLEVGGFIAGVAQGSVTLYGAQLRYKLLEGTPITPSLAFAAHYTGAAGLDDARFRSWGVDATVAQSFLIFKPYAGVGYVWGRLSPRHGIALAPSHPERVRGFAGIRMALLPMLYVGAQYERVGRTNTYSASLGLSIP